MDGRRTIPDNDIIVALKAVAPRPLLSRTAERRLGARHREVLDRLEDLLLSDGFAQFTITDLAAGVSCSRRTLYEIAASKEQLVLVVLDRHLHRKGRSALAAIDPNQSTIEQLRTYITTGGIGPISANLMSSMTLGRTGPTSLQRCSSICSLHSPRRKGCSQNVRG